MPKGTKLKRSTPPQQARCDFCGQLFAPPLWNCRTCVRCAVAGAPDQSKPGYAAKLRVWQIEHGAERRRLEAAAKTRREGA
jgi:hypothetical protein